MPPRNKDELPNGFRFYRQLHRCSGWHAGFALRGVRYSRYFADAAYGSAEAAREAAERFASENRDLHVELLALRRRFEIRRNSRSNVPGVSRYEGDGAHGPYWMAYWDDSNGRRVSRKFSINRFGEAEAFDRALKAREQGVGHLRKRYEEVLRSLGLVAEDPARGGGRRGRR